MSTPPPSRSLNRQRILDEDEYTEALSHIIARDFFPSLVHLDATNDYLDALHTQDPILINASVRRLHEISSTPTPIALRTPAQTPYTHSGSSDLPPAKRARYDTDQSLDSFQARYTSEDNASFTQILNDENRKRKERWAWAWDAQKRVEQQRDRMLEERERRLIEAPPAVGVREKFMIEVPTPAGLITDGRELREEGRVNAEEEDGKGMEVAVTKGKGKEKESTEGDTTVDVMAPKKDTRSAGVDGWNFKTRNALMFSPDADVSPYDPSSSAWRQTTNARGDPKAIKHGNTRLPEQDDSSSSGARALSAPPSPTRSRIDAAIAGTPYRPRSPSTDNFSLVPTIPSPTPSELGPAAVKQLMTWGTLNATPRILSQTDDPDLPPPRTPFHIPAPSSREAISQKLSNNAAKSLRAKAGLLSGSGGRPSAVGKKGSMAPPTWTPRRADAAGTLTPAAKRLLDRTTMGTAAARRAEAMGRTAGWSKERETDLNRVRWTPTPSPVARRG